MGLFTSGPVPVLGIDISSTAVKLLHLSRIGKGENNYRVDNYVMEPLPEKAVEDKVIKDVDLVGEAVERAVERAQLKKIEFCAVAVAGSAVITKTIQMPEGLNDQEMATAIEVEAEQYIPYPTDEVSLDFEVIGPNEKNPEEEVDVLLAASKSDIVDDKVAVIELGGLVAKIVDIELFALENAFTLLVKNDPEIDSEEIIALIDVGATTTSIHVLHHLKIIFTREQDFGGNQLTEQIQHQYGLSFEEASLAKRKGGLPAEYEAELLTPFKEAMVQEVHRAIQFYYSTGTFGNIAHIVIAGGCASIPGIVKLIADKIGGHVTLANPFVGMAIDAKQVDKKLLTNDAPALMIACGLALRSFDKVK